MKLHNIDILSVIAATFSVAVALISVGIKFNSDIGKYEIITTVMLLSVIVALIATYLKFLSSRRKPKPKKGQIFFIYAREDREKVEDLNNQLREAGFETWIDTKDLLPGKNWRQEVTKAIEESDFALACISQNTTKPGFVQRELDFALKYMQDKPGGISSVIPVRLEDSDVPERLSHLHWVDLFSVDGKERLIQVLRAA